MEEIITKWENGIEVAYTFDNQSRLNAGYEPEAIGHTEFSYLLNLLKKKGQSSQFSKRHGFTQLGLRIPSFVQEIKWIDEVILGGEPYLVGIGVADNVIYYSASSNAYFGWSSLYVNPRLFTQQHPETLNLFNSCYLGNLVRDSALYTFPDYDLEDSRVILRKNDGTLETYPFGLATLPADRYTLASANHLNGALEVGKYYFYAITALYDGYMESNASLLKRVIIGGGHNSVDFTYDSFPTTNRRIEKFKIYRSHGQTIGVAPDKLYYLTTVDVNGTDSPFYVDRQADSELTEQISPSSVFLQLPAYRNRYWCLTNGRLIQANLQSDYRLYSSIPAQKISLSLETGTVIANGVTPRYRISKVIPKFDGDKYVFIAGEPVEVSILNNSGTTKNVKLTLNMTDAEYLIQFGDWNNYVMVERKSGWTDFRFVGLYQLKVFRAGVIDNVATSASNKYNDIPIEIVKADGVRTSYDSPTAVIMSEINEYEKFSENNGLIVLDRLSNSNVTGIFDEENRVIIFTDKNIYQIGTEPISPQFWVTSKIIDGLGARGGKTPKGYSEYCCQGIIKLPSGSGYIFCNQTYKERSSDEIIIYYWDGKTNTTTIISNEIASILNTKSDATLYSIRGMTYDSKNNYIWLSVVTGETPTALTSRILVFDLENKQWYHWVRQNIKCNSFAERYDQSILVGGSDGFADYYDTGSYSDRIGASSYGAFKVGFNTKNFHFPDALLTGAMLKLEYDTDYLFTSVDVTNTANNNPDDSFVYQNTGYTARNIHRANETGNRCGFNVLITAPTAVVLKGMSVNIKKRNIRHG